VYRDSNPVKIEVMTATLNDELQQIVRSHGDRPVEVLDPATNRAYVLISRDQYDRLRPLFENDPLSLSEQRRLLQDAGRRAGWDDPAMSDYDRYDELKHQQP
jgi:hypothetical protein